MSAVVERMPLLRVSKLTKRYQSASPWWRKARATSHCTVNNVSFTVARGEVLGVVGESGSGKTTLARMLLRLVSASSGSVHLDGTDVLSLASDDVRTTLRARARMIFQDPDAVLNPAYTIGEGLARAIRLHQSAAATAADIGALVTQQLQQVGLAPHYAGKYPDQLSGGEKRRIGICRALCTDPSLVVADEPLSGLDVVLQEHVLSLLLAEQARRQFGLILVSHDLDRVRQVCDRVLVMCSGEVVDLVQVTRDASGTAHVAYTHPYSAALEAARDRLAG